MTEVIRVVMIEDEQSAVNRLRKELDQLTGVSFTVLAILDSVKKTVAWLKENQHADLLFMDIHLTDGLSLEVFRQVEVYCPVIFTTAYDEYALQAFKVNSIDYLLKPIDSLELQHAIDRFLKQKKENTHDYFLHLQRLADQLQPAAYRSNFLVSFKQKMMPIHVGEVAYLYVKERGVFLRKKDNQDYVLDLFLDDLERQLDPAMFYRANRQFLVARAAIVAIEPYFNGRLMLTVRPHFSTPVIISKEKSPHFKRWADY